MADPVAHGFAHREYQVVKLDVVEVAGSGHVEDGVAGGCGRRVDQDGGRRCGLEWVSAGRRASGQEPRRVFKTDVGQVLPIRGRRVRMGGHDVDEDVGRGGTGVVGAQAP
jgi:hypothetical protein